MRTGSRFSLAVSVALAATTTWAGDEQANEASINVGYDEFYDSVRERPVATPAQADVVPVAAMNGALTAEAPAVRIDASPAVVTPRGGTERRQVFDDGTWLETAYVSASPP